MADAKTAADETPKEKRHPNVPRIVLAKQVVLSDEFCALPPSSRLVYVYSICYADSHGIFSTRAKPTRDAGADDSDFDELILRGFVLDLTKAARVYVLRHNWLNNNFKKMNAGACPLVEDGHLTFEGEPYYSPYCWEHGSQDQETRTKPKNSIACICDTCGGIAHWSDADGVGRITCPTCGTYEYKDNHEQ